MTNQSFLDQAVPSWSSNWHAVGERIFVCKGQPQTLDDEVTAEAFSEKWTDYSKNDDIEQNKLFDFQKSWFLELYGLKSEHELKEIIRNSDLIIDAGAGLGYKSAWFASLSPKTTIIAMDYSASIFVAHQKYSAQHPNIIFVRGDIASTGIRDSVIDLCVCDQVIMHTSDPRATLKEFSRVIKNSGKIFCYWYKKKALPRELIDEYFREETKRLTSQELWDLSREVLQLGKMLNGLKVTADFPDLPSLGIKGGRMDLQRFIYWNFIKCFWNEELGYNNSLSTNFDWYSPAKAKRFSKTEVFEDLATAHLSKVFFHEEEACFSGVFEKVSA